jgi:iron complex transport system substrate-binding protein
MKVFEGAGINTVRASSGGRVDAELIQMARPIDEVTGEVISAAMALHKCLGPGLLESVYEALLARQLERRGLRVERHKQVAFEFDGMHFEDGLRVDPLVEGAVVVELKSVERTAPVHSSFSTPRLRVSA